MGDSGSGNPNQFSVAKRLGIWNPDFFLHCGDVVYEKGEAEGYGPRFMEPYQHLIDHTVFYPTPGNHDYGLGNLNAYTNFFEMPRPKATDPENYYTFTYGDAQFFALDSIAGTGKDSAQTRWLAAQLAASKSPWKIAYFHHPFYSSGWEGPSPWLAKVWGPLFEKYNVQVVFSGHDHDYERIKLSEQYVKDGHPTQYIVTGGGGAWLRGVHPKPYTQITQAAYHFVGVSMTDRELTAEAIDDHGLVIDQFTVPR
jgi:3',5'-cyclic AMP phosphodiesterase CpdA